MARQGPSIAARASTGLRRPCRAARRWERPNHTPARSSQVLNGGMNLPGGPVRDYSDPIFTTLPVVPVVSLSCLRTMRE